MNLYEKEIKDFKFDNSKNCCLAPYSTLNFDTMGQLRVCCYNSEFILGTYPANSIEDAWNNPQKEVFINKIKNLNFPKGCGQCKKQILQKNISNSLFSTFDNYDSILNDDSPAVLNFEFGTICNYECIMCGGKWSSSIRKNRENLPPLKSPYDEKFLEQVKPFIRKAKFLNFLGGEPFLNPLYYKIWNYITIRNPNVKIYITTNGSVFNSRIESYVLNLKNLYIIISLDSLKKNTYEFIRKNGNFENVMSNIEKFKKMNKLCAIAFCPIIQNIYELPEIIKYCINNKFDIKINDVYEHLGGKLKGIHENEDENVFVWTGNNKEEKVQTQNENLIPEVSISKLPKDKIKNIIDYLEKYSFESHKDYDNKYKDFIKSLYYFI